MPSADPVPNRSVASTSAVATRRTFFRWSSLAVGGVGVAGLVGCGIAEDEEPEPDPLLASEARARIDASTALALIALTPEWTDPLTVVATERTAHADALGAEIERAAGATTSYVPPDAPTTSASAGDPPTLELLRERLVRSGRDAADLARLLQGYRAGLLASIGAACTVQTEVVLP